MPDRVMTMYSIRNAALTTVCLALLASCGGFREAKLDPEAYRIEAGPDSRGSYVSDSSMFDAFKRGDAEVKVNRFLWTASLDVLDFLPVQTADPFTGVISTGYGRPPNGGQPYRATILISDPALDARALNVAMQSQRGPVDAATERAVEDAILNRARQLRIQAARF